MQLELTALSYTYNLNLTSGRIASAFVVDYLGDTFYNSTTAIASSASPQSITFNILSARVGVGLVALTDDNNITLSYTAQNATSPSSTSKAATDTVSSTGVASSPSRDSVGAMSWSVINYWWTICLATGLLSI